MSLLAEIKRDAKKSGGGLSKVFFVKDGEKRRVRFITDFEDAIKIPWISCYDKNIGCVNPEYFGKTNPYKDDPDIKEDTMYLWQVKDYDSNTVKPFMYKANNCSPVFNLAAEYEIRGTITDRDYVITCNGVGAQRKMPVISMDKQKLREPIKKLSKEQINKILIDAYSKYQGQQEIEQENYVEMTPKELYNLCVKREIEAERKKSKAYYVSLLEEYDEQQAAQTGFDDEEDDWGDDEEETKQDYEDMSAKELYNLCVERKIEAQTKKKPIYYITLLEEDDRMKQKDLEWDEEQEEEDSWDEEDEWEDDELELSFN